MARTNSNAFRVTVVNQQLPVWRSGQAVGEYREILGSSISLAPYYLYQATNEPGGKVVAWTGWSVDTRNSKVYSVANGGHADYYGNEVDVVNLEADAPAWSELLTSGPLSAIVLGTSNSYNTDGRPVSRHSYYSQQFIESLNGGRAIMVGVGSAATGGFPNLAMDGFNPATNTFDPAGTYPNIPTAAQSTAWATCKHPTTEDVYFWPANNLVYRWTKGTTFWSVISGNAPVSASNACSAIDPTRGTASAGRMLVLGPGASHTVDLGAAGAFAAITLTGALAPQVAGSYKGMIYEPVIDRFLFQLGNGGGDVFSIHPSTWAVEAFPTTGGTNLPAALNSVLTRWLYVPRLGGIVFGPGFSPNLWFLRTH